jgi:hypothetical protein
VHTLFQAVGFKRAQEAALEWQNSTAVAAGAFGEQDQALIRGQQLFERVALFAALARFPLDEHRPNQSGQKAEDRPAHDIRFRDESRIQAGA